MSRNSLRNIEFKYGDTYITPRCFLFDEDKLSSDSTANAQDAIVAVIDFALVPNYPAVLYLANHNCIHPMTLRSVNRNYVNKRYGSISKFLRCLGELLVSKDCPTIAKVIPNSIGVYQITNFTISSIELHVNGKLLMRYEIAGIDPDIYKGNDFTFIRSIDTDGNRGSMDALLKMSDEELANAINNNALDELAPKRDIAILIPDVPNLRISNRRLKKRAASAIANKALIATVANTRWYNDACKVAVSEKFAAQYKSMVESIGEKHE